MLIEESTYQINQQSKERQLINNFIFHNNSIIFHKGNDKL